MGFGNWMQSSGLLDVGFFGPKYTWKRGTLSERLDRAICNPQWRIKFPEASLQHLARISSDHRPILLKFSTFDPNKANRPFRFQQMWLTHRGFFFFMKDNWTTDQTFTLSVQQLTDKLHKWN